MTRSANNSQGHDFPSEVPEQAADVWGTLVPHVLHPAKVATIEAMLWMKRPLSSNELVNLFGSEDLYLSLVSYHVRQLVKFRVLRRAGSCQRRGATETFYYFPEGTGNS